MPRRRDAEIDQAKATQPQMSTIESKVQHTTAAKDESIEDSKRGKSSIKAGEATPRYPNPSAASVERQERQDPRPRGKLSTEQVLRC